MIYFDTSALMSLFLADAHTSRVRARFQDAILPVYVSLFGMVEFASAVGVRLRMSAIGQDQARETLMRFDLWLSRYAELMTIEPQDHRLASAFVRRFELGLRAPDALHIAVCQRLSLPLLTFDERQAAAARRLGIICDPASATS